MYISLPHNDNTLVATSIPHGSVSTVLYVPKSSGIINGAGIWNIVILLYNMLSLYVYTLNLVVSTEKPTLHVNCIYGGRSEVSESIQRFCPHCTKPKCLVAWTMIGKAFANRGISTW